MAIDRHEHTYNVGPANLEKLAEKLILTLRIRSIPSGMKLFENADEMMKIEDLSLLPLSFISQCVNWLGKFVLLVLHLELYMKIQE